MDQDQGEPIIRIRSLTKRFDDVRALDGISLDVIQGEVFGLLGPDGAGKTTLMRVLCGVFPPDEGEVEVAGCDVGATPERVKPHVGYLAQRFGLYADLTVEENLRFCGDLFGVRAADFEERRKALLEITRLSPFTHRLAEHLSGGMKQKLALICTLIHRPSVLLLDEPTTGVDPASRRDFWRLLYGLPEQGVTIVVSTPYMDEAERCDRVALLHSGRVLECARPEELKAAVSGQLVNVAASPQRDARAALAALPGVRGVTVFGDRLHVTMDTAADVEAVRSALAGAGVEVVAIEPIEASLEDVFTEAVRGGTRSD